MRAAYRAVLEAPVPTIAVVEGLCWGCGLEFLLHLRNRLRRLEGVIFREVEEVCGLGAVIVQSGIGAIKDHDGGDLLGQGDGHVERVGVS